MSATTRLIALADELEQFAQAAGVRARAADSARDTAGRFYHEGIKDAYSRASTMIYRHIADEAGGEEEPAEAETPPLLSAQGVGRCARHPGLHRRTDTCERFITWGFAGALGAEGA